MGDLSHIEPALRPFAVPTAELTPDPDNVELHPTRNREAIRRSLARYRQQKPVVVDADGVVRKGNGTLAVAVAMGWTHVAAVRSSLTGREAQAYAVADNETARRSGWADPVLAAELRRLRAAGYPTEELGFDDAEVVAILERADAPVDVGGGAEGPAVATCPECGRQFYIDPDGSTRVDPAQEPEGDDGEGGDDGP